MLLFFAEQKDSNDTLAQKLVDRGAFSQAEFETAFPRNPFLDAVPEEPEAPSDATEEEQASYDAAIDALIKGEMNVTVEARLEAGTCTVLSTRTDGWAHGPVFVLALVYKPALPRAPVRRSCCRCPRATALVCEPLQKNRSSAPMDVP